MTTNTTSGVVLEQVLSTLLYEPTPRRPGEHLLFLRWATANPPKTIPLEQTWADSGLPQTNGYFIFRNAMPDDAAAFEQQMRAKLPEPTTSAFAWATSGTPAAVQTVLKTKLDNSRPCVDGDTQLSLPPGLESVGFANNAPVLSVREDGFITGFVVTHPALISPQSHPVGLILPVTGSFVGCVQFEGLTSRFAEPPADDSARKNLVNVSIDPHNPLDTQRNFMRFTGAEYLLTESAGAYFITRVS
jgi:hypothetical protein